MLSADEEETEYQTNRVGMFNDIKRMHLLGLGEQGVPYQCPNKKKKTTWRGPPEIKIADNSCVTY